MKAMVLAAGLGSRLRPLTDDRPKALVEIEGRPLLALVLGRLAAAAVTEVVINLHHLGGQIEAWVARHGAMGMKVFFSRETKLLDTGGALTHAGWFFQGDEPVLVHNVDVLSDIDLRRLMEAHVESHALATLACLRRDTKRPLLFDARGALCGRRTCAGDQFVRDPAGNVEPLGFCGIHAVAPRLVRAFRREGAFSIIDAYLDIAAQAPEDAAAPICAYRAEGARWRDAGRPENLRPLEEE